MVSCYSYYLLMFRFFFCNCWNRFHCIVSCCFSSFSYHIIDIILLVNEVGVALIVTKPFLFLTHCTGIYCIHCDQRSICVYIRSLINRVSTSSSVTISSVGSSMRRRPIHVTLLCSLLGISVVIVIRTIRKSTIVGVSVTLLFLSLW